MDSLRTRWFINECVTVNGARWIWHNSWTILRQSDARWIWHNAWTVLKQSCARWIWHNAWTALRQYDAWWVGYNDQQKDRRKGRPEWTTRIEFLSLIATKSFKWKVQWIQWWFRLLWKRRAAIEWNNARGGPASVMTNVPCMGAGRSCQHGLHGAGDAPLPQVSSLFDLNDTCRGRTVSGRESKHWAPCERLSLSSACQRAFKL